MRDAMGVKSEYRDVQVDFWSSTKLVNAWGERAVWSIGRGFGDKGIVHFKERAKSKPGA